MSDRLYTMGSVDMIEAITALAETSGESYPMTLNAGDLSALVFALGTSIGFVSWDDALPETQERAESLFSGIAETLGIQGV